MVCILLQIFLLAIVPVDIKNIISFRFSVYQLSYYTRYMSDETGGRARWVGVERRIFKYLKPTSGKVIRVGERQRNRERKRESVRACVCEREREKGR